MPPMPGPPVPPRNEIGFHIKEDGVPYRIRRRTGRAVAPRRPQSFSTRSSGDILRSAITPFQISNFQYEIPLLRRVLHGDSKPGTPYFPSAEPRRGDLFVASRGPTTKAPCSAGLRACRIAELLFCSPTRRILDPGSVRRLRDSGRRHRRPADGLL